LNSYNTPLEVKAVTVYSVKSTDSTDTVELRDSPKPVHFSALRKKKKKYISMKNKILNPNLISSSQKPLHSLNLENTIKSLGKENQLIV
jgi:hypothetical protein